MELIVQNAQDETNHDLDTLEKTFTDIGITTTCQADYSINDGFGTNVSSNRIDDGRGGSGASMTTAWSRYPYRCLGCGISCTVLIAVWTGTMLLV
jgi:hypothetical protein